MKFRDLHIGDSFDFVNDDKPTWNSFFKRCWKNASRRYVDSDGIQHRVGSINADVYHVNSDEDEGI